MRTIGKTVFFSSVMDDLGSNFYMASHVNIMRYLRGICREAQIDLRYNEEVVKLSSTASGNPVLHLKSGCKIEGDLVIGADGLRGVTRSFVPLHPPQEQNESEDEDDYESSDDEEQEEDPLVRLNKLGVRALLGATFAIRPSDMRENPRVAPILEGDEIKVWMESNMAGLSSLYDADAYVLTLGKVLTEDYVDTGADILDEIKDTLDDYHPAVRELVHMSYAYRKELQRMPESLTLIDKTQKVVLLGNAAFCAPWAGAYSDCIAFESAFTLARLLSRLQTRKALPVLMDGFQKIRTFRNMQTLDSEISGIRLLALPLGPYRDGRDQALGRSLDQEGDETAEIWGKTLIQFDYDALDAADEWWLEWGKFLV